MAAACSWACGGRTALVSGESVWFCSDVQDAATAGNHHAEADADTPGRQARDSNACAGHNRRANNNHHRKAIQYDSQTSQYRQTGAAVDWGTRLAAHVHAEDWHCRHPPAADCKLG
jgi:hypothetical protein